MDKLYEFEKNILTRTGVTPYRTEWKIIGDKENIGGTVDFVGKKADGSFVLIDWKTTAKLKEKFTNAFGKTAGYNNSMLLYVNINLIQFF